MEWHTEVGNLCGNTCLSTVLPIHSCHPLVMNHQTLADIKARWPRQDAWERQPLAWRQEKREDHMYIRSLLKNLHGRAKGPETKGAVYSGTAAVWTSMALLGPGEPCSQMEDWPGANSAIGEWQKRLPQDGSHGFTTVRIKPLVLD